MFPIRKTQFIPEWIDMKPTTPVPKIDWINDKILDIAYGTDRLQTFDLYYPNDIKKEKYPVLIFIHGGGFIGCDKRDFHLYPTFHALCDGFAVASLNYRLAPKAPYPNGLNDVKDATAYLRNHAKELRLNGDNFFVAGMSAGGNLTALLALDGAASIGSGKDYHVNAAATLCPLLDFTDWVNEKPNYLMLIPPYRKMIYGYLGGHPKKKPENAAAASAQSHIAKNAPPMYIQQGDKDAAIPYNQAIKFYEQLKASGFYKEDDLVLEILKGAPHGGAGPEFLEAPNVVKYLNFFKKYMKGE